MTSVNPVTPTEQQTQSPFVALNALIEALQVSIRDDNTLTDDIVRIRNLHDEVLALIITKTEVNLYGNTLLGRGGPGYGPASIVDVAGGLVIEEVEGRDRLMLNATGNGLKIDDDGRLAITDFPVGGFFANFGEEVGDPSFAIIGDGFGLTPANPPSQPYPILTTAGGRNFFVKNVASDTTFTIPAFVTRFRYQLTGGGAAGYKDFTAGVNCSGGSGESMQGTVECQPFDEVRVVIGAAVTTPPGTYRVQGGTLTKVEGSGTDFTTRYTPGQTISMGGTARVIDTITNDTEMFVTVAFPSARSGLDNVAGNDAEIYVNDVLVVSAKGGPTYVHTPATDTTMPGGSGGIFPSGMAQWDGGVGRRDSAGFAFGAGARVAGSGCGGNTSAIGSLPITPAGCGFCMIWY